MNAGEQAPRDFIASALLEELLAEAPVGLGLIDGQLRYVRVNRALAEIHGIPAEEHPGRHLTEIIPAAAGRLVPLMQEVLAGEPMLDRALVGALREGQPVRTFRMTAIPIRDAGGEVIGAGALIAETTAGTAVESELREARERLALMLDHTQTGTFEFRVADGQITWSDTLGPIWGRERGWTPANYEEYLSTLHPEDRSDLIANVERAMAACEGYEMDLRRLGPDGEPRWIHTKVHVICDENGEPVQLVGLVTDIEDRRRREERAGFLAQASLSLSESLDIRATLAHVAELAVPVLADWTSVVLVDEDELETIAVHHLDPDKRRFASDLAERYPTDPQSSTGVPQVLRSGRSEIYPVIDHDLLAASAVDEEHLRLIEQLDLRSAMIVPIVARDRRLGAMTFVFAESQRCYTTEDLGLAEELGRRAGVALENAILHERAQTTATTLQRSLLPEIHVPESVDVSAHYSPGQAGTEVGGDWYDVFTLPDGRIAIGVGDVMGRGIPAATKMGQLRAAARAYAVRDPSPASVLTALDALLEHFGEVSFATMALAFLDVASGELEFSSAGHLPPLIVPRGSDAFLAEVPAGPPLGTGREERRNTMLALGAGDSLVLYTDGLVERRDVALAQRLETLAGAARPGTPAGRLVSTVLGEMIEPGDAHRDDVVVLAVCRRG